MRLIWLLTYGNTRQEQNCTETLSLNEKNIVRCEYNSNNQQSGVTSQLDNLVPGRQAILLQLAEGLVNSIRHVVCQHLGAHNDIIKNFCTSPRHSICRSSPAGSAKWTKMMRDLKESRNFRSLRKNLLSRFSLVNEENVSRSEETNKGFLIAAAVQDGIFKGLLQHNSRKQWEDEYIASIGYLVSD